MRAMAVGVLRSRRRARRRSVPSCRDVHQRVVAEAACCRAARAAISPRQRPTAISGSGSSARRTATSVLTKRARRSVARPCSCSSSSALLAASCRAARLRDRRRSCVDVAKCADVDARARRRAHRRTGPRRRRSPAAAGARGMARLGQRVLDEGAMRLLGLGDAELALRDQLDRRAARTARCSSASLPALFEARTSSHRRGAPLSRGAAERSALRAATSSRDALVGQRAAARPSRRARRPRLRPCPAPRRSRPQPVMTTFMSVSQAASSTYSRSSSGVPCDDADRDRGHRRRVIGERASLPCASSQVTASCGGDEGAGDRRGAGAAVGLQHVAVERDGALAQRVEVEHAAQRAADQALDLLRAAALLAARRLAVAAGVGGARQHAVLGRDPALAAAALVRRHLLFDRGGAQHPVSPNSTSTEPSAWRV